MRIIKPQKAEIVFFESEVDKGSKIDDIDRFRFKRHFHPPISEFRVGSKSCKKWCKGWNKQWHLLSLLST